MERNEEATTGQRTAAALLMTLLSDCVYAAAIMPWGRPGPIRLPDSEDARLALIQAHINGTEAVVRYCPEGKPEREVLVPHLVISGFCPASVALCPWLGFDLDHANGHGPKGLVDPVHAMRCIAERADHFGLYDGLLANRSKSGCGRHVWLLTPAPVPVSDAVFAAAAIAAAAYRIAGRDAEESEGAVANAFLTAVGVIGRPGQSGAFEIIPRSTDRPRLGWALTLPAAGALAAKGGGIIVDAFTDRPISLDRVPRCDAAAWRSLVEGARKQDQRLRPSAPTLRRRYKPPPVPRRIHPRTEALLAGQVERGARSDSVYAGMCNLLGCGVPPAEAEEQVLRGGLATGLSEREVRSAIRSAKRQMELRK